MKTVLYTCDRCSAKIPWEIVLRRTIVSPRTHYNLCERCFEEFKKWVSPIRGEGE